MLFWAAASWHVKIKFSQAVQVTRENATIHIMSVELGTFEVASASHLPYSLASHGFKLLAFKHPGAPCCYKHSHKVSEIYQCRSGSAGRPATWSCVLSQHRGRESSLISYIWPSGVWTRTEVAHQCVHLLRANMNDFIQRENDEMHGMMWPSHRLFLTLFLLAQPPLQTQPICTWIDRVCEKCRRVERCLSMVGLGCRGVNVMVCVSFLSSACFWLPPLPKSYLLPIALGGSEAAHISAICNDNFWYSLVVSAAWTFPIKTMCLLLHPQ